jgi:hypothetical protein
MTIKGRMEVRGNPQVKMRVSSAPLEGELNVDGDVKVALGPVHLRLERFPLAVRIPFLKRAPGTVIAGALGPIDLKLDPFEAKVRVEKARVEARIGKDDLKFDVEGQVSCKMEIDAAAELPAKAFAGALKSALEEEN